MLTCFGDSYSAFVTENDFLVTRTRRLIASGPGQPRASFGCYENRGFVPELALNCPCSEQATDTCAEWADNCVRSEIAQCVSIAEAQDSYFSATENRTVYPALEASDPDALSSAHLPRDSELTYAIVGGNDAGRFEMDAATGSVFLLAGKSLDAENGTLHTLVLQVSDRSLSALSATTLLHVNVLDIDDEAPFFTRALASHVRISTVSGFVSEAADVDDVVLTVAVFDPDVTVTSSVSAIINNNSPKAREDFKLLIDGQFVHLLVRQKLDFDLKGTAPSTRTGQQYPDPDISSDR